MPVIIVTTLGRKTNEERERNYCPASVDVVTHENTRKRMAANPRVASNPAVMPDRTFTAGQAHRERHPPGSQIRCRLTNECEMSGRGQHCGPVREKQAIECGYLQITVLGARLSPEHLAIIDANH